ncbi:GNAT family N-acetyltransferase [Photobacterium leiognathi]|uniref:GNAT family N-acetyltransferase n=1 Tax=Photobacterium leiognathi TaxID=553611 RepID=UPI002981C552|nr:GNAT family N-acetyltransferase [Photobacterium leiognathi]
MRPITFINYSDTFKKQLTEIYSQSIIQLAPPFYNSAQIEMWANYPQQHPEAFAELLQQGDVIIAIDAHNHAIGFGQLHPHNYISLLYVSPQASRQGIGRAIYQQLEQIAIKTHQTTISVTASKLSKPLFKQFGFELIDTEIAVRNGIEFERYNMVKILPN